jgi:hypothetical protein
MKTILISIATGSLLAMLAVAQPPHSVVDRARVFGQAEIQPASSKADPTATAPLYGRRGIPYSVAPQAGDIPASPGRSLLVYVITGGLQFGIVDLGSGAFQPIGPGIPPDVGMGLVPGPRTSLITLAFSGNLDAIDPVTGKTSVVGRTGLHDCSMPGSYDPNCANAIGRLDGSFYATDFANNLYSVDPVTGAAKLIGLTGIPPLTFAPFSENPDGSVNVYDESLFSARGKLYANFAALAVNFATGTVRPLIPAALYQINPATGLATPIAPTVLGLTSIVNVNDTIYAFNAAMGKVVTLDVTTGQTSFPPVSDLDATAGVIAGATPARPIPGPATGR